MKRSARLRIWIPGGLAVVVVAWVPGCDLVAVAPVCGGLTGAGCRDGEFCRFETGTCGAADQTGECTRRPDVCAEIFDPVCGCDDQTYGNECEAFAAGISLSAEGECLVPLGPVS